MPPNRAITAEMVGKYGEYFYPVSPEVGVECVECQGTEEHKKDCLVPLVIAQAEEISHLNKRIDRFVESILSCNSKEHHKIIDHYKPAIEKGGG